MIKITVTSNSHNQTYIFYTKEVLIGSSVDGTSDLVLQDENIKPLHIKIEEENDRFIIRNITNDPFATLNNLPFGKRILKDQDVIHIGKTDLTFEGVLTEKGRDVQEFPVVSTKESLNMLVSKAIEKKSTLSHSLPPKEENEMQMSQDFEEIPSNIQEPIEMPEERDLLEEKQKRENAFVYKEDLEKESLSKELMPKVPQKKPFILDLPDNEQEPLPFKSKPGKFEKNEPAKIKNKDPFSFIEEIRPKLKMIGITLMLALITIFLIIALFFWKFDKESEKKIIEVSRGIADIALALTYAKTHHITPQEHNWSNPQFLKSSIASTLSPHHFSTLKLEGNGKIQENYLLRIYMNRDNSRFVIIAQPEPRVFHYFTVPDSIIVDSSMMTLRRIKDLKVLNRLLIDPDQLDSSGKDEIWQLIKNAEIITLDSLADEFNANGFKPPQVLKQYHPGSENYIYNSPRYSQVSERMMSDAIEIAADSSNSLEARKIKDLLASLAKLPGTVLYTSLGKEHALNAKMAISTLSQDPFFFAYIDYDAKNSKVATLLEEDESHILKESPKERISAALNPLHLAQSAASYMNETHLSKQPQFIGNVLSQKNPLYTKLNELSNKRKKDLLAIKEELQQLIEKEIEAPGSFSLEIIKNKAENLTVKIEELNISILKELHHLYEQHKDISLSEFLEIVEKSGLKNLIHNELFPHLEDREILHCNFAEAGNDALHKIDQALNFEELFLAIDRAWDYLLCEQTEDPQMIMAYQNQVKGKVVEKLNALIFFEKHDLESDEFSEHNREKLISALKKAWISDREEQDFYLNEFKLQKKEVNIPSG